MYLIVAFSPSLRPMDIESIMPPGISAECNALPAARPLSPAVMPDSVLRTFYFDYISLHLLTFHSRQIGEFCDNSRVARAQACELGKFRQKHDQIWSKPWAI